MFGKTPRNARVQGKFESAAIVRFVGYSNTRCRRLLLFNDTILVVKDSKTFLKDRKYVLKTYISIQSSLKYSPIMMLVSTTSNPLFLFHRTVATSTTPETFEFSIIAVQKSFVFFANNEEERQEWIVELKVFHTGHRRRFDSIN